MLIGFLQCGHFPTVDGYTDRTYTELYSNWLSGRGLTFKTWSVVDMEFPSSIHDAEGWLITGSKYGAYEDLPFIPPLEDFIRECYAADVPQVGICFGHQIIAKALGGKVEKFKGGWSIGRTVYDWNGAEVSLNAWHQDQVTDAPADATTTATSDFCKHAAFAYKGRAMSVQPHPEFNPDDVDLLLDARAPGVVPPNLIESAKAKQGQSLANAEVGDQIARFFKESTHG